MQTVQVSAKPTA